MLTIELVNDNTGTEQSSNYLYRVFVNSSLIEQGYVTGHNRANPWAMLVRELLRQREDRPPTLVRELLRQREDRPPTPPPKRKRR